MNSVNRSAFATPLFVALLFFIAPAHAAPEPIVSVSVNGSRITELYRGMPMLVSVTFMHPSAFDSNAVPILLAANAGPWTSSVEMEVTDTPGNLQAWPFHANATSSNTIVLDGMRFAQVDRWLTPQETSMLSTGKYSVAVTLNTTNVTLPGAWNGVAEAVPAELTVLDEPSPLSEAQAENKYSQLALYELFLANGQAALNHINQWLVLYPTNITAMRIKAMALDAQNRSAEAYVTVEQALAEVYARNSSIPEPPINLLKSQRQLVAKLMPAVLALIRTNQEVSLSWFGHPGSIYHLEGSLDLAQWTLVATNFAVLDLIFSINVPLSQDRRFFRVIRENP